MLRTNYLQREGARKHSPTLLAEVTMIVSTEYDGQQRKLYPKECAECFTVFFSPKHADRKYCSQKCMGKHSRKQVQLVCHQCGKSFSKTENKMNGSVHKKFFCSRVCKD